MLGLLHRVLQISEQIRQTSEEEADFSKMLWREFVNFFNQRFSENYVNVTIPKDQLNNVYFYSIS